MVCNRFASGQVTAAFFGVFLVELAGVRGTSSTKLALMANSTFTVLSTTFAKLFCDVVKSINWYVEPSALMKVDIISSSNIGCFRLEVFNIHLYAKSMIFSPEAGLIPSISSLVKSN